MIHGTINIKLCTLFTTVRFKSHINCIHVPKGHVGTDGVLRLSVSGQWRHQCLQKQVALQIHKQYISSNKPGGVQLNCSNQAAQKKKPEMVTTTLICLVLLLLETEIILRFKLKF